MTFLIILVALALLLQVGLFFLIRAKKKQMKEGVIGKYDIKNSADAWRLINDQSIPEKDRLEIEKLYRGEEKDE